ncbi:MAG: helix-turn-helix transcriptional regulator [Chloroflexi bacterium]|nr:helix-turn-helix transcriptional regulator [Chloroflexota bacterium]
MRNRLLLQFGLLIKAARQEAELYQAELATRAGVPRSCVSRIERGEHDLTVVVHCPRLMQSLDLKLELVERALGASLAQAGDPDMELMRSAATVPLDAEGTPSGAAT